MKKMDKDNKDPKIKSEGKSGSISLEELEKMSGGGGLGGSTSSKTHDLPEGSTR